MFWKSKKSKPDDTATTPAENIQTAREAIRKGDYRHATQHLAWALSVEPENKVARTLLDQLISQAAQPLDLVQWDKPPIPYPIVAVQAYIRTKQGELDTALALMAQIYESVPALPFVSWLVEWLENNPQINLLQPATVITLINNLNSKITKNVGREETNWLRKTLPSFSSYQQTHPQEAMLGLLLSIFYRKLGKLEEALALAQTLHHKAPDYFTATVLGNAYREMYEIGLAVNAFKQALAFNPQDIAIRLDIGDVLCENGQLEEGLQSYQDVLKVEPRHAWAYPSYLYYRSVLETKADWQNQLNQYAKANPNNERATRLLNQFTPYITELLEPKDATVNLALQLMKETDFPASLEVSLSSLEAPSAFRTLQLIQLELYQKFDIKWKVGQIQTPDPRLPRGTVDFVLWRYNGTVPEPNLPAPASEVAGLVAELAVTPYEINRWWVKAENLARSLSISRINDLLGVMLYPPPRPKELTMWVWLQRVQLAAAFMIARLETEWEGSMRKQVLFTLARGPMDWTVTAAIITLCQLVLKEGVGKIVVEALYLELLKNLPRPGGVPYEDALVFCSFYIEPSDELAQVARKMLK